LKAIIVQVEGNVSKWAIKLINLLAINKLIVILMLNCNEIYIFYNLNTLKEKSQ